MNVWSFDMATDTTKPESLADIISSTKEEICDITSAQTPFYRVYYTCAIVSLYR